MLGQGLADIVLEVFLFLSILMKCIVIKILPKFYMKIEAKTGRGQ